MLKRFTFAIRTSFPFKCSKKYAFSMKKWLLILGSLLSTLSIAGLCIYQYLQIPSFEEFNQLLCEKELSADGLSIHFLWKEPSFLGNLPNQLPLYQGITSLEDSLLLKEWIDTLSALPTSSEAEAFDQQILLDYMNRAFRLASYPYFEEPLSSNGGLHVEMMLLLTAYPFYDLKDIEQYLSLLSSFDQWVASLIAYENGKKAAGLFMPFSICQDVISQCDTLSNVTAFSFSSVEDLYNLLLEPNANLHTLSESFLKKILPFYEQGLLSEEGILDLVSRHETILTHTVAKSYEELADALWLLEDESIPLKGLCFYENGLSYYQDLVSYETGSDKDLSQLEQLIKKDLDTQVKLFQEEFSTYLTLSKDLAFSQTFPITSIPEQIHALQQMISEDFPKLEYYLEDQIHCEVIPISKALAPFSAPAFYIQAPIDNLFHQAVYINAFDSTDALSLFTTLAHEAFPGHLYQHSISAISMEKQHRALLRHLFDYPGFLEGWALYVEFYAYEHAKEFAPDTLSSKYFQVIALNRRVSLSLYALCDLMIHGKGAEYKEIHQLLSNYGFQSVEATKSLYEYIVSAPANYLKYYIGFLEILECKKYAKELLKEQYRDYDFHKLVVEGGSMPFSLLKKQIQTLSDSIPK